MNKKVTVAAEEKIKESAAIRTAKVGGGVCLTGEKNMCHNKTNNRESEKTLWEKKTIRITECVPNEKPSAKMKTTKQPTTKIWTKWNEKSMYQPAKIGTKSLLANEAIGQNKRKHRVAKFSVAFRRFYLKKITV